MQELWSSASYEAHLLSLPFALAPTAMLIVIAYTAVMRGAPVIRGYLLAHAMSLLPYGTVVMLSPSIKDPDVADQLFRFAACSIPLAAATGTGFQLALVRKHRRYRTFIWCLIASTLIWVVLASMTTAALDGVRRLAGFWYPNAGRWAWLALVHTLLIALPGFLALGHAAWTTKPSDERRQLRAAFLANAVTYAGLVDVGLAYGIGVFPFGWLLSGIGSLLVVRALVVEDLLRVRAVDTTAPRLVLHLAGAIFLGWVCLAQVPGAPWWGQATVLALTFVGVRASISTVALIDRGARGGRGPLERLIAQLVARSREITDPDAIAQLAIDVVDLGVGVRAHVLLVGGGGWVRLTAPETISASLFPDTSRPRHAATDEPLGDEHAPRAPLMSWLTGHHVPLFHDDLEVVPGALRDVAEQLFERQRARAVVPVRSADELLAIIVIPHGGPRLRGASLAFVERVAERLAEALLHARMASRAAARAALAREVQLAATVQGELLPGRAPHVHGAISVVGSWHPATRCAGDFWAVHALADARVLVTIGDVTGHGVASAMVTAAAVGACDVFVRRSPSLDLAALVHALDAAVRRVGGGELAMTCFAAVLDPAAHTISYVSCGHTTPYLCRVASAGKTELQALVGRGNLLGAGTYAAPKLLQRPLEAGDLVVWYTDGVIEAQDPAGKPFGDRRLQQLLRKLDVAHASSHAVHDLIEDAVAAHRQEHPLGDDATLVVAHVARTGA